jgi:hypothetical protein
MLVALLVLPLTALTPGHLGWLAPRPGQATSSRPADAPSRDQALRDAAWRWRDCRPHHWRDCLLQQ